MFDRALLKGTGNVDKHYIGRTDSPLLNEGIESSKSVGKQIIASGEHIDAIYTSDLSRQLITAQVIAKEIGYLEENIIITDFLLERAGGTFEGKPQTDFFNASEDEQIHAGAEAFKDLSDRAIAVLERAKTEYPDGTILFVGSATIGEMIRTMVKYNDYTKVFDDGPMPNSELIRLI